MKRFLLISDCPNIATNLTQTLNASGEQYELIQATYRESRQTILENKFDRIFCGLTPEAGDVKQQIKLISALDKATNTPVTVIPDRAGKPIFNQLHKTAPGLDEIPYSRLRQSSNSGELNAVIFGSVYADRTAERQRSEAKSRTIAKLEIEIERLKMRATQLEEDSEKCEVFLHGGTLGQGLLAMSHSQSLEIADLRADFDKFCRGFEEKRSLGIQKTAIIVGAIATIFGALAPFVTETVIQPNLNPIKAAEVK